MLHHADVFRRFFVGKEDGLGEVCIRPSLFIHKRDHNQMADSEKEYIRRRPHPSLLFLHHYFIYASQTLI